MTTPHSPADQAPTTLTFRWPWRTSELASMAITATAAAATTCLITSRAGTSDAVRSALAALAVLAICAWLYSVKTARVRRSQVVVTLTGARIHVHQDGPVGDSAVDAVKVKTIARRKFGSDDCLILSDGTQAARVPARTLHAPQIRDFVSTALAQAPATSAEAASLIPDLHEH